MSQPRDAARTICFVPLWRRSSTFAPIFALLFNNPLQGCRVLVRVVRLAVWPNELRFSRASRGRRQRVTQIRWFISETFESELVRCVVTICSVSDGRDPVAELARTTGRADPRNENAPTNNRLGESPPLAPADYPSAPERAYERHRHDDALSERPYGQRDRAYDVNYGTEEYTIEMSREPQLIRLVLVIAIFVAGTGRIWLSRHVRQLDFADAPADHSSDQRIEGDRARFARCATQS
jgi:hypothetical protein